MHISFNDISAGKKYSRPELAEIWGYDGYQALARGVVTPRESNIIILFVTEIKQAFQEQYNDKLNGNILEWEGPTDHFAEQRIIDSTVSNDEIHVFHRIKHHTDFTYLGKTEPIEVEVNTNEPSKFKFKIEEF